MKKFLTCFLSITLTIFMLPFGNVQTFADNLYELQLDELYFAPVMSDEELQVKVDQYGKELEREKNEQSQLSRNSATERWEYIDTKTLVSNKTVSTKYIKQLSVGQTVSNDSFSFSFTAGVDIIDTFQLQVSFNGPSKSVSYAGPSYSDYVANNNAYPATHSYVVSALQGTVVQYTYKVYNQVTGIYLRTETINTFIESNTLSFNLRANVAQNGKIVVENVDRTKTKTFSTLSDYKASFGTNKASAIYF